jgi:hypothetical protein
MEIVKQALKGELASSAPVQVQLADILPQEGKRLKMKRAGLLVTGLGFLATMAFAIIGSGFSHAIPALGNLFSTLTALASLSFVFVGPMILLYTRLMYKRAKTPQVIVVQPYASTNAPQYASSNAQSPSKEQPKSKAQAPTVGALPQESYNFDAYRFPPRSVVDYTDRFTPQQEWARR